MAPAREDRPLTDAATIVLRRLIYLHDIRVEALKAFGVCKPRARLKNSLVMRHVANALGREPSAALGRDVLQALSAIGWKRVRHSNCWWWKGVGPL